MSQSITDKTINRQRIIISAIIIVLLAGLFLRTYDLELDPPVQIGKTSQDLITDPPHLTSFAVNKAKFGQSEPFPFAKWQVFKVSLVSAVAYLLVEIGSPNRIWTNLAGVIPSFLGLAFLVWGLAIGNEDRSKRYAAALIASVLLSFNFILVTYNRAPFMESGLIFYFGLIFLLYQKYRFRIFNLFLLSFLVALAFLTGKAFAVSIGVALLAAIFFEGDSDRYKKAGLYVAGGIISAVLIILILYGESFPVYWDYLVEHSFKAHGEPFQTMSLWRKTIGQALLFGTLSRLFVDSPFIYFAGYLSLVVITIHAQQNFKEFCRNRTLQFCLIWLAALLVIFIFAPYRPLRYQLLIYLPLILIIASTIRLSYAKINVMPKKWSRPVMAILALINWFFLVHLIYDFYLTQASQKSGQAWKVIGITFIPAILITYLITRRAAIRHIMKRLDILPMVIGLLILASAGYHVLSYVHWINLAGYSTRQASRDLAEVLGPNAVLTGPYAPALTLDNNLRHFIYAFGLEKPDFNIFERFPITHIAVDESYHEALRKDFPELQNAANVTDYLIRDMVAIIVRVAGITENQEARAYQPTDFEKASFFFLHNQADSALVYNERFLRRYPMNKSAIMQRFIFLSASGQLDHLLQISRQIRAIFPEDFDIQIAVAVKLKRLGLRANRQDLLQEAQSAYMAALQLAQNKKAVIKQFREIR